MNLVQSHTSRYFYGPCIECHLLADSVPGTIYLIPYVAEQHFLVARFFLSPKENFSFIKLHKILWFSLELNWYILEKTDFKASDLGTRESKALSSLGTESSRQVTKQLGSRKIYLWFLCERMEKRKGRM